MERPEVIEAQIKDLQRKLIESKMYHQFELIKFDSEDKMIGFYNIGNTERILGLLNSGNVLRYRHMIQGCVDVWMNPQRNRILVSKNEDINEDNILNYIIRYEGDWYLDTKFHETL